MVSDRVGFGTCLMHVPVVGNALDDATFGWRKADIWIDAPSRRPVRAPVTA